MNSPSLSELSRCSCLACPLLPVPSSGRLNRVSWPCKMTGVAENHRMRMVSLKEGTYEYKYVVDGEWTCNKNELVTTPNSDDLVNNYIKVVCDDLASTCEALCKRLTSEDPDLREDECLKIRQFLESFMQKAIEVREEQCVHFLLGTILSD